MWVFGVWFVFCFCGLCVLFLPLRAVVCGFHCVKFAPVFAGVAGYGSEFLVALPADDAPVFQCVGSALCVWDDVVGFGAVGLAWCVVVEGDAA